MAINSRFELRAVVMLAMVMVDTSRTREVGIALNQALVHLDEIGLTPNVMPDDRDTRPIAYPMVLWKRRHPTDR